MFLLLCPTYDSPFYIKKGTNLDLPAIFVKTRWRWEKVTNKQLLKQKVEIELTFT